MSSDNNERTTQSEEGQSTNLPVTDPLYCPNIDPTKMMLLFKASKTLASTVDQDELLGAIGTEVRNVLDCEGTGVVLYDEESGDFYWKSVQDKESLLSSVRERIRIPKDSGVAAWVFTEGKPALIHDATTDPRIYRGVETESGFMTRTMICVPLRTAEKSLGVLYALNKVEGRFTDEDVEILMALSTNIALALDHATQYDNLKKSHQELERLNRVKNKILNHLSHELKTPIAIIEASLAIIQRKLAAQSVPLEEAPVSRITRNLGRLKVIEKQVGHIVEEKDIPARKDMARLLDLLKDLMEIEGEEDPEIHKALEALARKIEELFPPKLREEEWVAVEKVFPEVEFRVKQMTQDREINVEFLPPDHAVLLLQPQIVRAVLGGIVRNAVENTPDHGKVAVEGRLVPSGYEIVVRDCGIGIPESELPNLFEGFYPVRETDLYTSGRRYAFNAGGTGTDLLKIKIFSQRFGFHVRFSSSRCTCIPTIRDICPGDITKCSCCREVEDCYNNGGTEFVVEIPSELVRTENRLEESA